MPTSDATPPSPDSGPDHQGSPQVGEAESGQKILQFLERRLRLPPTLLHRWVRTGQVRLNGGRCKPFERVQTGDVIRLPPFALKMAAQSGAGPFEASGTPRPPSGMAVGAPLPPMVGTHGAIWAFCKPAGLPTQPGTGHSDSLVTRLTAHYADAVFKPTPAHRLDKDTSGILLVGASFSALRELQDAFRQHLVVKEYVAWVRGSWPWAEARLVRHHVRKGVENGYEKMLITEGPGQGNRSQEALCLVSPLLVRGHESLLLIRLFTGRTHQIRVQLASLGHPVLGDGKYGPPHEPDGQRQSVSAMYLHALRVTLPGGHVFACLPDWQGQHAVDALPESADSAHGQEIFETVAFPVATD